MLVEYSYFISLSDNLRPPPQSSPAQALSRGQVASSIFLHRGVFGGGEGGGWTSGALLQLLFDELGLKVTNIKRKDSTLCHLCRSVDCEYEENDVL